MSLDAPITEALLAKMGGAINYLLDNYGEYQVFTSNGIFNVPDGVNRVFLFGCGGGGAGGGGRAYLPSAQYGPGAGGAGAHTMLVPVIVTPLDAVAVTIGAGGVPNSGNGGDTIFGSYFTFKGGAGGGSAPNNGTPGTQALSRPGGTDGGVGSNPGRNSALYTGGAGPGGGGGGAGWGGNGGAGGISGGAGTNGSPGLGYGAGGGGGGAKPFPYSVGAAGYQGFLAVYW